MRAALALMAALAAQPAKACGLELVLAMDVSRSVVNAEFDLQMGGLADAFRDPEIMEAIRWMPGGAMVTVTQWSGPSNQAQMIGWRHLTDEAQSRAFAEEIDAMPRQFFAAYTAVGEALWHADKVGQTNPRPCRHRVIDISGDGASNRGRAPRGIADGLAAKGITVNGLAIKGAKPDPEAYYTAEVIAGPGAFLEVAAGFEDYAEAIRRKLLREMSPSLVSR